MKKVIVFGSSGMAGHIVTRYLKSLNKYKILNASRSKLDEDTYIIDVFNKLKVIEYIKQEKPNVIINCIGTLIKESDSHPDIAIYINSYFPRYLEKIGFKIGYKLIHLSTDCVFSGDKGNYSEYDEKDGKTIYAKTKSLGEIINDKDLTIRTSIIGPELKADGEGLFHWFLSQEKAVNGYNKVLWTGITTLELAKAMETFIDKDITGLYHLVPGNKISKYELLKLIKKIWTFPLKIIKSDIPINNKSLINNRRDFIYDIPKYEDMLNELYDWMSSYEYEFY